MALFEAVIRRGPYGLKGLSEQTMLGAVPIQHPVASPGQADLKVPLRPTLEQRKLFSGDQGGEGQIMSLFHGMRGGEIPLILDGLTIKPVILVWFLNQEGFQPSAAAGEGGRSGGGEKIPTLGTEIKREISHRSSIWALLIQLSRQQLFHGDAQQLCQPGQEGDDWTS